MECPECGYSPAEDDDPFWRKRHRKYHDLAVRGPRISAVAERFWGDSDVTIVDAWSSNATMRHLAYDASCACRRSGGWDSPSFPYPGSGSRPRPGKADISRVLPEREDPFGMSLRGFGRAYLLRGDSHVVGFLMTWPIHARCQFTVSSSDAVNGEFTRVDEVLTCSLGPIWVAPGQRRRGLGARLLNAVSADPGRYPGPLSVEHPLTESGAALLHSTWRDRVLYLR